MTKPYKPVPPAVEPDAETLAEFCTNNRISRSKFYELQAAGEGPAVFYIGRHIRISKEASKAWRRQREKAARDTHKAAATA